MAENDQTQAEKQGGPAAPPQAGPAPRNRSTTTVPPQAETGPAAAPPQAAPPAVPPAAAPPQAAAPAAAPVPPAAQAPAPEATKPRSRKASDKPFLAQVAQKLPEQPADGGPFASILNDQGGTVWVDLPTPEEVNTTVAALKWVKDSKALPNGRYRVVQLCADKIKDVVETIKTTMADSE